MAIVAIGAAVLLSDGYLVGKRVRQSELVSLYSVNPNVFSSDFDGDGAIDAIAVERHEFVIRGNGQDLLRIPRDHTDGTFRTQLALRDGTTGPRLLVFDVAGHPANTMRVFARTGVGRFAETSLDAEDLRVLRAIATGDDGGTRLQWGMYTFMRTPILIGLAAIAAWLMWKAK